MGTVATEGLERPTTQLERPRAGAAGAAPAAPAAEEVGLREVELAVGVRVAVVGPLLLATRLEGVAAATTEQLVVLLESWEGPGCVVLAGDVVDLIATDDPDLDAILDANAAVVSTLRRFAEGPAHQLFLLPGLHDAALARDPVRCRNLCDAIGARAASSLELRFATAAGERRVRVEPGARFDPRAAPSHPGDTPLAHHLFAEIIPSLGPARFGWLAGIDRLPDLSALPRFLVSRLTYRAVFRYAWWLVVPLVLALLLKLPLAALIPVVGPRAHASVWPARVALIAVSTLVDLVLVAAAVAFASRRTWAAVAGLSLGAPAGNEGARAVARELVTEGLTGLVTAHTLAPELTPLGPGFYANCGAGTEVVVEHRSRFGLPSVFLPTAVLSYLELEGGADLHVRLLRAARVVPGATRVERFLARGGRGSGELEAVTSWPNGERWPPPDDGARRDRRVRRVAAAAIGLAGVADLVFALTPPLRPRLDPLFDILPLGLTQAASALVALAGLSLLALAGGIRRGQRQAWLVAVGLLAGTSVLQITKAGSRLTAVASIAVLALLLRFSRSFTARVDRPSLRRGLAGLAVGLVAVATAGTVVAVATTRITEGRHALGIGEVALAVVERLVGVTTVALPRHLADILTPILLVSGIGLAAWAAFLAFRPAVNARRDQAASTRQRARELVSAYGRGTLDYFALRDDKQLYFFGQTVVAYGNWGGVCLVSPDPIGPPAEHEAAWQAFRRFADRNGWTVGVLGAGEEWLPTYRASGMRDLYVGDEAVVDVRRFTLAGGRHKGLRQAVHRVERHGYSLRFFDPARLEPELAASLAAMMDQSRRGEAERGFSMTLGRIFDPADRGLLLAVAFTADDTPAAFCQYVPAPGIDGYSLDLMRRDLGAHPNGLLDFVVVGTIEELRRRGQHRLGLNFATMRVVLAGETGDALPARVERWVLRRMSGSMQIESLWRFNAKYDPSWQPRFVVYESPERLPAVAMAIARAESFWELPGLGRLLTPPEARRRSPLAGLGSASRQR